METMTYPIPADEQTGPATELDKDNEGITRCYCGSKYYENDRCADCGEKIVNIVAVIPEVAAR